MSLAVLADHMASKGRGPDSMLIHMSPREVQGLQALAEKHGGSLTINPHTGLPEAGFLDKLLPAIIGFAITATTGIPAWQVGLGVGAVETARTGDLGKGISAGLGAYGGAGLGAGLTAAPVAEMAGSQIASQAVDQAALEGIQLPSNYAEMAAKTATPDQLAAARDSMSIGDLASKTATNIGNNPSSLLTKDNFKYLAAGAAPILADQAVKSNMPTTTTKPGMIRPYSYDPYGGTYTAGTPYEVPVKSAASGGIMGFDESANSPMSRQSLSNMENTGGMFNYAQDGGGVMRMAEGGIAGYALGGDIKTAIDDAYAAGDYAKVNELAQTNKVTAADVADTYKGFDTSGLAGLGINLFTPPAQQAAAQQTATTTTTESPADAIARIGREQAERARIANANLAALQPTNTTATTGGGLATLANATGATTTDATGAGTTTGGGLATLANATGATTTGATTTGRPTAEQAAATVATVYRNVLGRDPDPNGMAYWTQQLTSGNQDSATMYADFIRGAQANKETGNFGLSLEDAQKGYTGYSSADASNIADEWVRNVLGREVTDADRKTQWYKDAVNKDVMNTYAKAENIYNNFRDYAALQTGSPAANLDLYQASKLMGPQAKTTVTGGGGNDVIVPSGYHLENGLIVKNVDATQHTSTVVDTPTSISTADRTALPVGVSGAGITTINPNGTISTRPDLSLQMQDVRDAYTKGGGSLGVNKNLFVPKTQDELFARYKNTGGSKAAFDYLMGKTPYSPVPVTPTGEIQKPYWESVGKAPVNLATKKYIFKDGKYEINPAYVKPSYVQAAEKAEADKKTAIDTTTGTGVKTATIGGVNFDLKNRNLQPAGDNNGDWTWSDSAQEWIQMGRYAVGGLAALTMARGGTTHMPFFSKSTGKFTSRGPQVYGGGGMAAGDQFDLGSYSDGGRLLRGPGDGVSDSIPATIGNKRPARLADGEFVVPARIVSELGNGSTEAGARKLYAMMDRVQAARKGSIGKGKVANNSRADKYLPV